MFFLILSIFVVLISVVVIYLVYDGTKDSYWAPVDFMVIGCAILMIVLVVFAIIDQKKNWTHNSIIYKQNLKLNTKDYITYKFFEELGD